MLRRIAPVLITLAAVASTSARAQTYTPQPVPRTTSAPTLHAQALSRQIRERFTIGLGAETRGDWPSAIAEFERILALAPGEPQGSTAHYDLSIAYAGVGRYDDAAAQLRAAIALDPGFLAAMSNLIAIDARRGDLTEARAVADRFAALAPDSARALYSQGLIALRAGDAHGAQTAFSLLIARNPSYAVAHYDLGLAEIHLGSMADAEREFGTALSLSPTYARARFALGTVLLHEGRRTEARAQFDRAARDAGGDATLHNVALAMRDAIAAH